MEFHPRGAPGTQGREIHPVAGGQQLPIRHPVDQRTVGLAVHRAILDAPSQIYLGGRLRQDGQAGGRPLLPVSALPDGSVHQRIAHPVHTGHVLHRCAEVVLPRPVEAAIQENDLVVVRAEPVCAGTHHPPAGDRLTHKIAVPCPAEGIVHPGRSNALGGVKAQVGLHPSGGTGPCKTAAPVVIVVQRTVIRAVVDHGSSPGLGQAHHVRGQLGLQRQPGVAVCGDRQPKGTVVSGLLPDKIAGHLHGLTLILLLVPGRAAVVDAALPARLPVGPGEGVLHPVHGGVVGAPRVPDIGDRAVKRLGADDTEVLVQKGDPVVAGTVPILLVGVLPGIVQQTLAHHVLTARPQKLELLVGQSVYTGAVGPASTRPLAIQLRPRHPICGAVHAAYDGVVQHIVPSGLAHHRARHGPQGAVPIGPPRRQRGSD